MYYSFAFISPEEKVAACASPSCPSFHQTTVTVVSSRWLLANGAGMLINLLNPSTSPPPNAFRIKCELTFSSSNDQEPRMLFLCLSFPSTVGAPDVVGTSSGRAVLGIT